MSFYKINGNLINIQYINSIAIEGTDICIYLIHRSSGCVCVNCDSNTPCTCTNPLFLHRLIDSHPDYEAWKKFIDSY